MVFFEDTLDNGIDFRSDTYLSHIQHYPCDTDYSVIVMSDPEYRSDLNEPRVLCKSQPLKLRVDGMDNIIDLLPYARVELDHDAAGGLQTPLEFIQNYQDILTGRHQGWQLHAVVADEDTLFLYYINLSHDQQGEISLKRCPKVLWLDVPELPQEAEDEPRGFFGSFRKPDPVHGSTSYVKTTPVAIEYVEGDAMYIWTSDDARGHALEFHTVSIGQQMLRITPDPDEIGDYKIERIYHQSDIVRKGLPEYLQQFTPGFFAL